MPKKTMILAGVFVLISAVLYAQIDINVGTFGRGGNIRVRLMTSTKEDEATKVFTAVQKIILYEAGGKITVMRVVRRTNKETWINFDNVVYFERDLDDDIKIELGKFDRNKDEEKPAAGRGKESDAGL